MFYIFKKDSDVVFVGKVSKVKKHEKDGTTYAIVSLTDFKDEKVDIFFKNNAQTGKNRADKVLSLNLKEGDFIAVIARVNDDNSATATGIRVVKYGRVGIGDMNIYLGTAVVKESKNDNIFQLNVPVREYVNDNYVDQWYQVPFFNGDKRDNATKAKKVFGDLTKAKVCILCGKVTEKEYNDKKYHSMTGYKIVRAE